MKDIGMMRVVSIIMAVFVISILMPVRVHSWNPATHAYIEEHLYKKQGDLNNEVLYNRIYGANALDIFNDNFTSPYPEFAAYLHDTTQDNFMKVWEMAKTIAEKSFAYGFVGHNNTWGMDSTAHISGITFGRDEGYVIAKAHILAAMLKPMLESQLGPLSDNVLMDICHYLVESGVDLIVRNIDPSIGIKLMNASYYHSVDASALLANAFADDPYISSLAGSPENAKLLIAIAEGTFRVSMINYGWALTQDNALDLVSEGMAKVGTEYLHLPPGSEAVLVPLVKQGVLAAMTLCAPDIERELRASTGWVNGKLSSHGISW